MVLSLLRAGTRRKSASTEDGAPECDFRREGLTAVDHKLGDGRCIGKVATGPAPPRSGMGNNWLVETGLRPEASKLRLGRTLADTSGHSLSQNGAINNLFASPC
jgi:hypothetical protein